MIPVMPLAPTLLVALTPQGHEITLVDMVYGDQVDYEAPCDLAAITVRTPLAVKAYEIADRFRAQGTSVLLGGPHVFACPSEAKGHASAVAVGEAEDLWSRTWHSFKHRPSPRMAMNSFFAQMGMQKTFKYLLG